MQKSPENQPPFRLTISDDTLRPIPALVPFTFAMIGAIGFSAFAHGASLWLGGVAFIAALAFAWAIPRTSAKRLAWIFPLVLAIGFFRLWSPSQAELTRLSAIGPVEIEGTLVEDRLIGSDDLADLNANRNVRLKLERVRQLPGGEWQTAGGTIILRNPDDNCAYGRRIRAEGKLTQPPSSHLPGTLNLRVHYLAKGIRHQIWANTIQIITQEPTGYRRVIANAATLREKAMERLLSGVEHPGNRQVIGAMTLGFRGSLSPYEREIYLKSGMLHLFAISGLHVGILFTILIGALRLIPCSMRTRLILAPLILLVYVVATGMAPSAIRAWLMLSVWSFGKAFAKPVVGLNTILAAATIQLIWNPLQISSSGFQYSYVVVATLVLGWQRAARIIRIANEKQLWVPARFRRGNQFKRAVIRGVVQIVGISILAWLGGFGLTVWYNGLILPVSWFWNSLAAVNAWLLLAMTLLKGVLSLVSFGTLDGLTAWPTALLSGSLRLLAQLAADQSALITSGRPPLLAILAWYGLLLSLFLVPLRHFKRIGLQATALLTCAGIIIAWYPVRQHRNTTATVASPRGALAPVVLVRGPAGNLMINTGSRMHAGAIGQWLRLQGIDQLDVLILPVDKASWNSGLTRLASTIAVSDVYGACRSRDNQTNLHRQSWMAGATFHPITTEVALFRNGHVKLRNKDGRPAPIITLPDGFGGTLTMSSHKKTGWQIDLTHQNGQSEILSVGPEAPATVIRVDLKNKR